MLFEREISGRLMVFDGFFKGYPDDHLYSLLGPDVDHQLVRFPDLGRLIIEAYPP